LFDRQIGGLGAFEDLVDVPCRAREQVPKARPIGEETARGDVAPKGEDRGQAGLGREGDRVLCIGAENRRISEKREGVGVGLFDLLGIAGNFSPRRISMNTSSTPSAPPAARSSDIGRVPCGRDPLPASTDHR
jgi:hypothetical protein